MKTDQLTNNACKMEKTVMSFDNFADFMKLYKFIWIFWACILYWLTIKSHVKQEIKNLMTLLEKSKYCNAGLRLMYNKAKCFV